jgi:hypothetical protein
MLALVQLVECASFAFLKRSSSVSCNQIPKSSIIMKKCIFILLLSATVGQLNAQSGYKPKSSELGLHLGYSTYLGDLQPKDFTQSQPGVAIGASLRKYFTDRISAKFFANFTRLSANDNRYGENYRYRNLSFRNDVKELGFQAEISMFRFDNTNLKNADNKDYYNFTPYVFAGVNMFYSNPKALYQDQWVELQPLTTEGVSYGKVGVAIPFGLGFKYQTNSRMVVGVEFGLRKTFTDYLDDVSNSYPDMAKLKADKGQQAIDLSWRADEKNSNAKTTLPQAGTRRGNPNQKDWYTLAQFVMSYNLKK